MTSVMEAAEATAVKGGAKRKREEAKEDEGEGGEYSHVTDKELKEELKRRHFKVGGERGVN